MGFPNFRQFRKELEDQPDTQTLGLVVQKNLDAGNEELISFLQQAGFNADGTFNNLVTNNLTVNNITNNPLANAVGLLRATRTLSAAQIATLQDTPLQLLTPAGLGTAPGIGFTINPVRADWTLNTTSGAFSNIASDCYIAITLGAETTPFGPRFVAANLAPSLGIQQSTISEFEPAGAVQQPASTFENQALYCAMWNGLGDLTGGTGATLLINVYYVISPTNAGTAVNTIVYTTTARKVEPPAATRIAVTPSGTSFAYSNWFEIDSATAADWALAAIAFDPGTDPGGYVEFQVGKGAAGSESVVASIAGRQLTEGQNANHRMAWMIPIGGIIRNGNRVAVRMRKTGTNTSNWLVALEYFEEPMAGNAVTSSVVPTITPFPGNNMTPSATSGGYSNWAQQVDASPLSTDIVVSGAAVATTALFADIHMEESFGVGAAGQEETFWRARYNVKDVSTLGRGGPYHQIAYPALPIVRAGQALTARMRKSGTDVSTVSAGHLTVYPAAAFPLLTTELPNQWYPDTGNSLIALAASGSAWANAAYTVMFTTTTPIAVMAVMVNIDTTTSGIEIDVATGTPGNEVVKATVRIEATHTFSGYAHPIPLVLARNIGTGEIVSLRCRSASTVIGIAAGIGYMENPDFYQRLDTASVCYPSAANATTVAGANTAWNNSNYGQLTAATSSAVYLTVLNYISPITLIDVEFDLAVGAAASEVVIGTFTTHVGNSNGGPGCIPIVPPIRIANNVRLAVRFRKTGTDTSNWSFSAMATPV